MLAFVVGVARTQLKTPGVVSGIKAIEQAGVGQFDEAPIEGRFIVTRGHKGVGNVAVAEWGARFCQHLQHRHPAGGAAQSGGAHHLACSFDRQDRRRAIHV